MNSDLSAEDIPSLTDDELFERLSALGVSVGPIVESTRSIYQKKLISLLGGDVVDSQYSEDVDMDEYSGNEEIGTSVQYKVSKNMSPKPSKTMDFGYGEETAKLRKRLLDDNLDTNFSRSYSSDLHTPSPRPSLNTVRSSSTSTTPNRSIYQRSPNDEKPSDDANKFYLRLFVKLVLMVLFIFIVLQVYQHYSNTSPLEGLQQLARQALDAHEGNSEKSKIKTPPKSQPAGSQPK